MQLEETINTEYKEQKPIGEIPASSYYSKTLPPSDDVFPHRRKPK